MNSPLIHISVLGILLLAGVILRAKVGFLKRLFIPASLIAGLIGLALGQYGLKLIPADMMGTFSSLAPYLITIVFAPMLIGVTFPKPTELGNTVGPQVLFAYIGDFLLIAIPLLVTALWLMPIWDLNDLFGTVVEVGFVGGHGTAAGMGEIYDSVDWDKGGAMGLATATVGLFIGIFCGIVMINHGIRKGYTSFVTQTSQKAENGQGIYAKNEQPFASRVTVSKDVVEPLAFHFGIIALAIVFGLGILWLLQTATGLKLPLFPMAMIGGLLVQLMITKTGHDDAVDHGSLNLIQGLALELLIVSSIASLKVPLIIEYALPIVIVCVSATLALLFHFYYLGPRMFKNQWFEHSIVNFGGLAGVTAVGLMLLRTVDPEVKSDALKAYAMRSVFVSPVIGGGLLTSILPLIVVSHGALLVGFGFLMLALILVGIARLLGFWRKPGLHE
ncbi:hypothetical protein OAP14_06755 [Aliiglaciecola sp.]|nr:hypothetical protein [Aliiglaciecola sp.]